MIRKYNLTIAFSISLLSFYLITSTYSELTYSTKLSTYGSIDYNGHMGLTLKYSTNFETVTKRDASHLNMEGGFQNVFNFEGSPANMWVEGVDRNSGIAPYSGSRCVGMETIDAGYRVEFVVFPRTVGVGDELFIREWLYLPPDWTVGGGGWYGMLQVSDNNPPNWHPYYQFMIQDNQHNGIVDLILDSRDVGGTEHYYQTIKNFALPRGQWFKLEWYEFRDSANGVIKCWINGRIIFYKSGLNTKAVTDYHVETAKIYHDAGGTYKLWVDDLEIYG